MFGIDFYPLCTAGFKLEQPALQFIWDKLALTLNSSMDS